MLLLHIAEQMPSKIIQVVGRAQISKRAFLRRQYGKESCFAFVPA